MAAASVARFFALSRNITAAGKKSRVRGENYQYTITSVKFLRKVKSRERSVVACVRDRRNRRAPRVANLRNRATVTQLIFVVSLMISDVAT